MSSLRPATVKAIKEFDSRSEYLLKQIQKSLRSDSFEFLPQTGILKKKKGGFRGIVTAPITNRIVERAILDCLQTRVPFIKDVIATPTSIGGVPHRGVGHGLALVQAALNPPNSYYIRSDISGFFDNIPRSNVLEILKNHIEDEKLLKLIKTASSVVLENEQELGENRKIFPESDIGVAQGSPLSALFGNILLHEFDKKFNSRGITCVRFIDDFILLGEKEKAKKAFTNAKKYLSDLGLTCHDPYGVNVAKEKAQYGKRSEEFIFLGYKISSQSISPGDKAISDLFAKVNLHIAEAKQCISDTIKSSSKINMGRRYVQTLYLLDRVILGWTHAFSYSNVALIDIDKRLNESISNFNDWFQRRTLNVDENTRRRVLGVCIATDIPRRKFDDLPFTFEKLKVHRSASIMTVVSTDGSRVLYANSDKRDVGAGGWAAVFHNPYREISGGVAIATNNQMELQAVIEALQQTEVGSRVHIITDSKYIVNIINSGGVIRENVAYWRKVEELCIARKTTFEWIKSHSGDVHNEKADELANYEAAHLSQSIDSKNLRPSARR